MDINQDHVKNLLAIFMKHGLREKIDLNKIHPIVFKYVFELVTGELHLRLDPYEFGEGPSPVSLCDVDNDCIKEAADYVNENNLVNAIALELLDSAKDEQPKESTAEVELYDPEGEPPPGEYWNEAKSSTGVITHKVHVDPIENETELLHELVRQGIIGV
ncbi:hypothetical protein EG328_004138 [Venturia inaequalis]|uniref:Uncharacterized protein n=1 Tax=Venturia inaequalis TaxID=5025 RepID=A0A8H3VFW6_VENIN|nr:hypothetical protein EG328_004138 [Venturia inaequalis]